MALAPKLSGHLLPLTTLTPSSSSVPHTLELYLDYVCPFSAKQFKTFYTSVVPLIKKKYTNPGVRVIFRQQVQPWHPSSTLVHEAGLAVAKCKPDKFWDFSEKLFERQAEYFDVNVVNERRNETYKRLAHLAASVKGLDENKIFSMLKISDVPGEDGSLNTGNEVTNDLKTVIKLGRFASVHVSPTVLFDGLPENSISSSWTVEQWEEWLEKNLK